MKIKLLILSISMIMGLSLTACNLPEVTPPPTEAAPSVTPVIKVPPLETPTINSPVVEAKQITTANVSSLVLAHKAAVSNIQFISWSSDSQSLAVVTQNSDASGNQISGFNSLKAADLSTQSVFSTQQGRVVAVAPDGRTIAVLSNDLMSFQLIDTADNNKVLTTITPGYLVGNISFSPDMRYIAVIKMELWEAVLLDFKTYSEVSALSGFETAAPVFNALFDQSPRWLAWIARGTIQLQDIETGEMGPKFSHEDFVSAFAISPDGTILASSAGKTVNGKFLPVISIWDTSTGEEIRTLETSTSEISPDVQTALALTFSHDGKILIAAVGSGLQIWDPLVGSLLATLTGHADSVTHVAISPDGKTVASSGLDNQLYLWQTDK